MKDFTILYEDDSLLVINKPGGVVVNRAESVKKETVQDWMEKHIKSQITNPNVKINLDKEHWSFRFGHCDFCSRSGVVHRLDKETSGCLILAKIPEAFFKLQAAFKERTVKKTYIALVHGKLISQEGEINAPVGRLPWNREQFGIVPGGKEAVTRYKVIRYFEMRSEAWDREVRNLDSLKKEKYPTSKYQKIPLQISKRFHLPGQEIFSLVELHPETGRTHQIRVHLKYLGFPIVGDYLYAGRKQQKSDRVWCPRVFLHASKIQFPHPVDGRIINVETSLPTELQDIISSMNKI